MGWRLDFARHAGKSDRRCKPRWAIAAYDRPMDDVPDLRDSSGRMKRLILALTVAVIVGAGVYGALYAFARPDDAAAAHAEGISVYRHTRTAFQFVFYFTGAAVFVAFLATLKIANHMADKKYMRELTPEAKLRR